MLASVETDNLCCKVMLWVKFSVLLFSGFAPKGKLELLD